MKPQQHKRCSPWRLVWIVQILLVILIALVMIKNLGNGFMVTGDAGRRSDAEALHFGSKMQLLDKLGDSIRSLQPKVDKAMQDIQQRLPEARSGPDWLKQRNVLLDVAAALDQAAWMLQQLRNTSIGASSFEYGSSFSYGGKNPTDGGGGHGDAFLVEEINRYLLPRPHRLGAGRKNFMGSDSTQPAIGAACMVKKELRQDLERYMGYDIGDYCPDDWPLGQKLMVQGCDPLPRRRCLARTPQHFSAAGMRNASSRWSLPDDRNVRWSNYKCKSFGCLAGKTGGANKGLFKCSECFDLQGFESRRWMLKSSSSPVAGFTAADFSVDEVLGLKPAGEIRIGLDFSVGTGSFAARMRERNVTVVSATLNLGGPFNEAIALRGLVPLYVSVNQRLPFFDNTLDVIHTTLFLDGWIDHVLLDFIVFDWDRVLRPGGLLWIDKFFCTRDDLEEYLYFFLQLHYKKHLWVVAPKLDRDAKEVYFSAVLEKPLRPF